MKKPKSTIGKKNKTAEGCDETHTTDYVKQHEKGKYPRRIWPTDSNKSKDRGQKI